MDSWNLAKTNYSHTKDATYDVAVLPFGATEPHNLHLPYGTDTYQVEVLGERICQEADRRGAKVLLLPTIPYGTQTNMRELPLAMNLYPSTLQTIIVDLLASLVNSGVKKVLLLNGHGGNDFKPILRELAGQTPAQLFLCDWFRMVSDQYDDIFENPEDHAGEMETSLILAYFPELVNRDASGNLAADQGATNPTRFDAVNQGWVSISRPWHLLTSNSGSGNPHKASAEKGEKLMNLMVDRLSNFLVELASSPMDETFPF